MQIETPASGGLPESPTAEPRGEQESEGGLSKPLSPSSQPAAEGQDLVLNEGGDGTSPVSERSGNEDVGSNAPVDSAGKYFMSER